MLLTTIKGLEVHSVEFKDILTLERYLSRDYIDKSSANAKYRTTKRLKSFMRKILAILDGYLLKNKKGEVVACAVVEPKTLIIQHITATEFSKVNSPSILLHFIINGLFKDEEELIGWYGMGHDKTKDGSVYPILSYEAETLHKLFGDVDGIW